MQRLRAERNPSEMRRGGERKRVSVAQSQLNIKKKFLSQSHANALEHNVYPSCLTRFHSFSHRFRLVESGGSSSARPHGVQVYTPTVETVRDHLADYYGPVELFNYKIRECIDDDSQLHSELSTRPPNVTAKDAYASRRYVIPVLTQLGYHVFEMTHLGYWEGFEAWVFDHEPGEDELHREDYEDVVVHPVAHWKPGVIDASFHTTSFDLVVANHERSCPICKEHNNKL